MARGFRRRSSSPARRTNWFAGTNGNTLDLLAPGDVDNIEVIQSTQLLELVNYSGPTIVRVRGWIHMDPQFASNVNGSSWALGAAVLWVGPAQGSFAGGNGPADIFDTDFLRSDRILATYMHGFGQNVYLKEGGSTDVDLAVATAQLIATCEVDVKAMRKLSDDNRLMLSIGCGDQGAGTVGINYNYMLRVLIKE